MWGNIIVIHSVLKKKTIKKNSKKTQKKNKKKKKILGKNDKKNMWGDIVAKQKSYGKNTVAIKSVFFFYI